MSTDGQTESEPIEKFSSQQLNWRTPAPPSMRVTVSRIPREAETRNRRCSQCGREFKAGQRVVVVETDVRVERFHARCFKRPLV